MLAVGIAHKLMACIAVMFYCVFIHDYGPHEHVFSAVSGDHKAVAHANDFLQPQRWFKEKTASWRAVSPTHGSVSEEKKS
jgi:hypothetical protein